MWKSFRFVFGGSKRDGQCQNKAKMEVWAEWMILAKRELSSALAVGKMKMACHAMIFEKGNENKNTRF